MHVFLIGFMGSGKSHTGRQLAQLLQFPFVDLDQAITASAGQSIPALFAEQGEAYFRRLEWDCLRSLGKPPYKVIACGGGTPCHFDNMDWMNRHGLTIYLRASVEVLAERLRSGQSNRPLLNGLSPDTLPAFIERKLAERTPYYMQASVVYDQQSPKEEVAQAIYQEFSNIIGH